MCRTNKRGIVSWVEKKSHDTLFCYMSLESATANMFSLLPYSLLKWVVTYESLDAGVSATKRGRSRVNEMKVGQIFRELQKTQQYCQNIRGLFQPFRERASIMSGTCCLAHVLEVACLRLCLLQMQQASFLLQQNNMANSMERAISRHPAELF